jgi:heptosyltransferase-2
MHIAAAIGTPTVAIFGPTSPAQWAPLNPLAAIIEPPTDAPVPHRNTADVKIEAVAEAVRGALASR